MKKIVAFGASNSSKSINQQLAKWASSQLSDCEINLVDLNDYEMPIYSMDREQASGIPEKTQQFKEALRVADGIIISFAEHNGSYSAAFKNIFDWMSRIDKPIWMDKKMFLMATSPGGRGGAGVLAAASGAFPHQGGQVAATFSLPSFNQHFKAAEGITDAELKGAFEEQLVNFRNAID